MPDRHTVTIAQVTWIFYLLGAGLLVYGLAHDYGLSGWVTLGAAFWIGAGVYWWLGQRGTA